MVLALLRIKFNKKIRGWLIEKTTQSQNRPLIFLSIYLKFGDTMKKKYCFIIIIVLFSLVFSLFCNNNYIETLILSNNKNNVNSEAIDKNYNTQIKLTKSNSEITNLNSEYKNIWKELIDLYYQQLTEYYKKEQNNHMQKILNANISNFNDYVLNQMLFYEEIVLTKYETGSVVPILLSEYEMKLYRAKALELENILDQLGIETIEYASMVNVKQSRNG